MIQERFFETTKMNTFQSDLPDISEEMLYSTYIQGEVSETFQREAQGAADQCCCFQNWIKSFLDTLIQ